jgi:transposase
VKNTDPAESKGYDAGKKVSGIKRHLAVDSRGLPHLLHVTTADVRDKAGAKEMIQSAKARLGKVEAVLVNGGYNGQPFVDFVREQIEATVEVAKRSELHTFAVIPKRWVVERSISWLEKCRRLRKNCERKLASSSLAMIRLAFISLLRRLYS